VAVLGFSVCCWLVVCGSGVNWCRVNWCRVNWCYGYDGILDRLFFIKRVTRSSTADYRLPRTIALKLISETHGVIVPLKSWSI
jgi:hypothetical protein